MLLLGYSDTRTLELKIPFSFPHPHGVHVYAVRAISEATNDSALLLHISNFGAARARAMKSGSGAFDVDDYVGKLVIFMGGRHGVKEREGARADDEDDDDDDDDDGQLDWGRIGWKAMARSHRVPTMDFM